MKRKKIMKNVNTRTADEGVGRKSNSISPTDSLSSSASNASLWFSRFYIKFTISSALRHSNDFLISVAQHAQPHIAGSHSHFHFSLTFQPRRLAFIVSPPFTVGDEGGGGGLLNCCWWWWDERIENDKENVYHINQKITRISAENEFIVNFLYFHGKSIFSFIPISSRFSSTTSEKEPAEDREKEIEWNKQKEYENCRK